LREALLVNPYDIPGTAQVIQRALHMPLAERLERHTALLERIRRDDAARWRRNFLDDLRSVQTPAPAALPALSA